MEKIVQRLVRDELRLRKKLAVLEYARECGNEVFVYFSERGQQYCMRMAPERLHRPGDQLRVQFGLDKMSFFDVESDERYV